MMRKETKIGILFFILSITLNRFGKAFFVEPNILCFITGACTSLGLVGIIIGMLPQDVYDNFKEWKKKDKSIYKRT